MAISRPPSETRRHDIVRESRCSPYSTAEWVDLREATGLAWPILLPFIEIDCPLPRWRCANRPTEEDYSQGKQKHLREFGCSPMRGIPW
jgi:hypothetical protein